MSEKTPVKLFGVEVPRNRIATILVALLSAVGIWWSGMSPATTEAVVQGAQDAPQVLGWFETFVANLKGGGVVQIATSAVTFVASVGNYIWHLIRP